MASQHRLILVKMSNHFNSHCLKKVGGFMKNEKLLQYSKELSLLSQLLQSKLITETEYQKIKIKLMNEYKIISDLTAMSA